MRISRIAVLSLTTLTLMVLGAAPAHADPTVEPISAAPADPTLWIVLGVAALLVLVVVVFLARRRGSGPPR